ncbi:ribbon-helix-helix domain-containing protein [Nocardioides hungaricus]
MTPKKTPTAQGRAVTDDLVDQLADEAEAGYDVHSLKRTGGRKPIGSAVARVIPVRLDPELEAALKAHAESEHTNASQVIRDALRAWLRSA